MWRAYTIQYIDNFYIAVKLHQMLLFPETSTEKINAKWSAEYLAIMFYPYVAMEGWTWTSAFLLLTLWVFPAGVLLWLSSHEFYTSSCCLSLWILRKKTSVHLLRICLVLFARHRWVCVVWFLNSSVSQGLFHWYLNNV